MADSLTQAAVTGTQNASNRISDRDLLQELGIRGLRRLAGFIPHLNTDTLPEAAPADEKPLCNTRTVKQFLWLIENNYHGLRSLWLSKFTESGQRIPDEFLPILMDKHRSRFGIPFYIHGSVGERAMWLANLPDSTQWRWFKQTKVSDSKPVSFGSRFGRHAEYRELRYQNSDEAHVWLDKHWNTVPPAERSTLLTMIRDNLNKGDLPFLQKQTEELDEIEDAEILQEIWYLLSLIASELLEDKIEQIVNFVHLDIVGKRELPILDFRWSNAFLNNPQYVEQGVVRKLAARELWWETLTQLVRLVPLDRWLQQWNTDVETLLNGARHGLHEDIFIPVWIQRSIEEQHEGFALGILYHQKPQINRFGWHVSHQSKLLDKLSFGCLQILLDEVWMNPEKEITWNIP